jgi:hypothetical protein
MGRRYGGCVYRIIVRKAWAEAPDLFASQAPLTDEQMSALGTDG